MLGNCALLCLELFEFFYFVLSLFVQCFRVLTLFFRYVVVKIHNTWADFQEYFKKQVSMDKILF